MKTPIKSQARKLIYVMIGKYNEKKREKEQAFAAKEECINSILGAIDLPEIDMEKIKESCKQLKVHNKKELITESQYIEEISSMTDVSVPTIKRIKKEGKSNDNVWSTPGKKRPHKRTVSDLDSFDISAIRNKINEFYSIKKQVPTLRTLLVELRDAIKFSGCRETLRKILLENGYEFKKNQNERSILIERHDIAAWRHRFLRTINTMRQENRQIIYLDETYLHLNYKPKKSWQGPSTSGLVDKISTGKRYIIVHAGSDKGFVTNALLTFSTKSQLADYHHDMNAINFKKWLCEKLIPNLEEPSVIVMDNASYHTCQINKAPTAQNRKIDIQNWLTSQGVPFEDYHSKDELLCFVNKNKPQPIYEVDEILKQHGHEVLTLPPYHCDLNAIEMIWSLAKRRVGSKNVSTSSADMEKHIKDAFDTITTQEWKNCVDHVIRVENKYKEKDHILETELERFIINVQENDSDSISDESFEMEFLESDFSYGSE